MFYWKIHLYLKGIKYSEFEDKTFSSHVWKTNCLAQFWENCFEADPESPHGVLIFSSKNH